MGVFLVILLPELPHPHGNAVNEDRKYTVEWGNKNAFHCRSLHVQNFNTTHVQIDCNKPDRLKCAH